MFWILCFLVYSLEWRSQSCTGRSGKPRGAHCFEMVQIRARVAELWSCLWNGLCIIMCLFSFSFIHVLSFFLVWLAAGLVLRVRVEIGRPFAVAHCHPPLLWCPPPIGLLELEFAFASESPPSWSCGCAIQLLFCLPSVSFFVCPLSLSLSLPPSLPSLIYLIYTHASGV